MANIPFLNNAYFAAKVGIGTESPTKNLEIGTSGSAETELRMHSDQAGKYINIQSAGNFTSIKTTGSQNFILDSSGSSGYVTMVTNGSERMRVNYNGNVGIGITNPKDRLDLYDADDNVGIYFHTATSGTGGADGLRVGLNNTHAFVWNYENTPLSFGTNGSQKATILANGNVGIGTTNPETSLTIENASGGAASTAYSTTAANANLHLSAIGVPYYNHLFMGIGSATYAWIQSQHGNSIAQNLALNPIGGNVGIGTTSPSTKLDVSGIVRINEGGNVAFYGGSYLRVFNSQTYTMRNSNGSQRFAFDNSSGSLSTYNSSNIRTTYFNNLGDSYINGGNVGIGTTNPSDELHVEGVIQSKNYLLPSTSGTAGWYKIGTLEGFVQGGATAVIEIAGHQGYNATNNQDYLIKLFIKTSNGSSVGPDGQKYNSWYERTGGNASTDIQFKWDNSATNDYHLYMYIPTHSLRSWYSVKKGTGTWDHVSTSATDPGANSATVLKATGLFNILDTNVGIGTTSPGAKLHVNSSDATVVQRIQGATNSALEFYNSSTKTGAILVNSTQFLIAADNSNYININTGGSERMRILSNGTILIGSTIDISDGNADDLQIGNTTGSHGVSIISQNNAVGSIYFGDNDNNDAGIINYEHGSNQLRFVTNRTQKMVINSSGNVGIGTTSPTHLLTLEKASSPGLKIKDTTQGTTLLAFSQDSNSHIGTYSSHPLVLDTNSTERMRITSAGHVGIGTASPQAKLQVVSSSSDGIIVSTSSNVEPFIALWRNSGNSGVGVLRLIDGGNIYFDNGASGAAQSTKMVITNAGNVGIGTTSPASKLDVQGGMSQFSTTLTNGEDWANSPISINERGQVGSAQSADKYAPNLNFHWAGRSSKSLWLNASGVLHFGEYSSTGIPDATGTFSVNTIALTGTGRITGVDTVSIGTDATSKTYVDNAITTATGAYLPLAGGTMTGTLKLNDNVVLQIGNSADFTAKHNGTDSYLENYTGNLNIANYADDGDIKFWSDNGSGGVTEYFRVDGGITKTVFTRDTKHLDNKKALFGDQDDLQIYHDGSNSYISELATGSLFIQASDVFIKANGSENAIIARSNDAVELYYDNIKKLETGIVSVGTATTAGGTLIDGWKTTTQANAINDTTIATTAYVNNKISLIPAGLVFQGTWNAATNTPTLTSGSGTTGHFYIVSTDGSTNLDGITDWKVGDWAVFVEQGASDQWEKVDNSSVLDGSGTGQKVTKWDGSGTSNTLTDGPITFSGNNSTFAGEITATSGIFSDVATLETKLNGNDSALNFTTAGGDVFRIGLKDSDNTFRISKSASSLATNTYLTINSSGDVGIGADNPQSKLHIESTGEALRFTRSGQETYRVIHGTSGLYFTAPNAGNLLFGITQNSDVDIFNTSGSVMFRADGSTSNVGIGTTSPDSLLHVSADVSTAAVTNTGTITIEGRPAGSLGDDIATIDFHNTGTKLSDIRMERGNTANDSQLVFSTSDAGTLNDNLIIDEAGNVGIGTTSPSAKFEVFSTTTNKFVRFRADNNEQRFEFYVGASGNASRMSMYNSAATETIRFASAGNSYLNGGNVGIGTTNPDSLLELENSPAAQTQSRLLHIDNNPINNQGSGYIEISSGSNNQAKTQIEQVSSGGFGLLGNQYIDTNIINRGLSSSPHGNINFATGSSTSATSIVMTIGGGSQKGNVGIGTVSPGYKLEVNGTTKVSGELRIGANINAYQGDASIWVPNVGQAFTVKANTGNVGIGTTSPSNKLDVSGTASVTNLRVGSNASGEGIIRHHGGSGNGIGITTGNFSSSGIGLFVDHSSNNRSVGIGTTDPKSKLDVDGGVKIGDDTDTASANKVGTLRYRTSGNNSYVDMCMQTGATTYAWINIVQNNW